MQSFIYELIGIPINAHILILIPKVNLSAPKAGKVYARSNWCDTVQSVKIISFIFCSVNYYTH